MLRRRAAMRIHVLTLGGPPAEPGAKNVGRRGAVAQVTPLTISFSERSNRTRAGLLVATNVRWVVFGLWCFDEYDEMFSVSGG